MDDSFCEHSETRCSGSRDGQVNQELPLSKEKYERYKRQKTHIAKIRKERIKRSFYAGEKKVATTIWFCTAFVLAENGTDLRRIAENMKSA